LAIEVPIYVFGQFVEYLSEYSKMYHITSTAARSNLTYVEDRGAAMCKRQPNSLRMQCNCRESRSVTRYGYDLLAVANSVWVEGCWIS